MDDLPTESMRLVSRVYHQNGTVDIFSCRLREQVVFFECFICGVTENDIINEINVFIILKHVKDHP